MSASLVPEPFRSINESMRLRIAARLARLHPVSAWERTEVYANLLLIDAKIMEDGIFTFDPFQARTLPVFESIYRYGRKTLS